MAFKFQSVPDRVQSAIRGFDYQASVGNIEKNWRSKLRLENARFGNLEKSVPALVFGSLERARSLSDYKFPMKFADNGCLATKEVSVNELRSNWEKALNTDPIWSYQRGTYFRMIKGITFTINLDVFGNGVKLGYGTELKNYRNVSSAKRAVRKMVQRGEI